MQWNSSGSERREEEPKGEVRAEGIVEVARRAGLEPDERQRAALKCRARQVLVCCTRQWGKSTVAALKALHTAGEAPDGLVVVVAPTERQAGLLVEKVRKMARRAGIKMRRGGGHRTAVRLENGSQVVGLAAVAATVRGYSAPRLVVVDEAAFVPDEVYAAVRPMLATGGGSIWLLSTPNGKQGFFYEEWTDGGADWERVKVTAEECARITKEYLEGERSKYGEMRYKQEYLCEFVTRDGAFFPPELLDLEEDER